MINFLQNELKVKRLSDKISKRILKYLLMVIQVIGKI